MMFIDGDLNKIGKAWYPYQLQYIPTFVVLIDGDQAHKEVTTSQDKIQAMVDNYGLSEDEYCDDCGDVTCDGDSCEPEPEQEEDTPCVNEMLKPQSQADYEQMVKDAGSTPVMVKFGTQGCGACRNVKAISEQIATETDCSVMKFIDGDLNKIGSAWYPYKLQYIPTFVILQDGKEVAKKVTTRESDLRGMVSQYGANQDSSAAQLAQLRESNGMQHPQSADEFDEMIAAAGDLPVQVKFTMNDCEACEYCEDSSDEIAASVDSGDMQFIEANINLVGEVRYRYGINAVPTFIVVQKGREIGGSRFEGGDADQIQSQVDKYMI